MSETEGLPGKAPLVGAACPGGGPAARTRTAATTPNSGVVDLGVGRAFRGLPEETVRSVQAVVDLAAGVIDGVNGASVSVMVGDRARLATAAASAERFWRLDEHQCTTGQGPAVEAAWSGPETMFPASSGRWPLFAEQATRVGVRWACSLPLTVLGRGVGSFTLYATGDETRTAQATPARGQELAAVASALLAHAGARRDAEELADNLRAALASRDVIGQAKGILMARQNISGDEAFEALRQASSRSNRKLRDVAAGVVSRHDQHRRFWQESQTIR